MSLSWLLATLTNLFTALFNLLSYLPTQACVPVRQELFTSCLVSIQCNSIESTKFPNIIVIRSCTLKLLKFSVPAYAKQIIFRLFVYQPGQFLSIYSFFYCLLLLKNHFIGVTNFCLVPHLLTAYTQQLKILVTALLYCIKCLLITLDNLQPK